VQLDVTIADDVEELVHLGAIDILVNNAGIAGFLQNIEFFGLGLDHDLRLPGLLQAVTLDEANAAARRIIDPDRATLVVAGPYQET